MMNFTKMPLFTNTVFWDKSSTFDPFNPFTHTQTHPSGPFIGIETDFTLIWTLFTIGLD